MLSSSVCQSGYTGVLCDKLKSLCDPNPCSNSAQCSQISTNAVRCSCPYGTFGDYCQNIVQGDYLSFLSNQYSYWDPIFVFQYFKHVILHHVHMACAVMCHLVYTIAPVFLDTPVRTVILISTNVYRIRVSIMAFVPRHLWICTVASVHMVRLYIVWTLTFKQILFDF